MMETAQHRPIPARACVDIATRQIGCVGPRTPLFPAACALVLRGGLALTRRIKRCTAPRYSAGSAFDDRGTSISPACCGRAARNFLNRSPAASPRHDFAHLESLGGVPREILGNEPPNPPPNGPPPPLIDACPSLGPLLSPLCLPPFFCIIVLYLLHLFPRASVLLLARRGHER